MAQVPGLNALPGAIRKGVERGAGTPLRLIGRAADTVIGRAREALRVRPAPPAARGAIVPATAAPLSGSTDYLGLWAVSTPQGVKVMRDGVGDDVRELDLARDVRDPARRAQVQPLLAQYVPAAAKLAADQKALERAAPTPGQPGAVNPLAREVAAGLKTVTDLQRRLTELLSDCGAFGLACFAAGTPLRTPGGWRPIEALGVGDRVLSRDEFDPAATAEYEVVEAVFRRTAAVWHLTAGGRLIRTTGEHPFYEQTRGWVPARELAAGDRLACEDGSWVSVEEAVDTGGWEPVYNLRVADHHTYFVGKEEWGFSVWAHNTSCSYRAPEQTDPSQHWPTPPPYVPSQAQGDQLGRTTGVLRWEAGLDDAGMPITLWTVIVSGTPGKGPNVTNHRVPRAGEFPGVPVDQSRRTHVEIKAATFMRDNNITSAILTINNPDGVCTECRVAVPHILLKGSLLYVEPVGNHVSVQLRGTL